MKLDGAPSAAGQGASSRILSHTRTPSAWSRQPALLDLPRTVCCDGSCAQVSQCSLSMLSWLYLPTYPRGRHLRGPTKIHGPARLFTPVGRQTLCPPPKTPTSPSTDPPFIPRLGPSGHPSRFALQRQGHATRYTCCAGSRVLCLLCRGYSKRVFDQTRADARATRCLGRPDDEACPAN